VFIIQLIANEVTTFFVYRFIIEMREVRLKLEATTFQQYQTMVKNHRLSKVIVYSVFFAL
jgi:hypothetical protein